MNCNYVKLGETPHNQTNKMQWVEDGEYINLYAPDPLYQFEGILAWINKNTLEYEIHDIVGDNCTCHDTDREYKDDIETLKKMIERWVIFEVENQVFFYTNLLKDLKRNWTIKN